MALLARPGRQGGEPPCRDSLPEPRRHLTHQRRCFKAVDLLFFTGL